MGWHRPAWVPPPYEDNYVEVVMVSDESEAIALLDTRVEACEAKNIDQLMSLYS